MTQARHDTLVEVLRLVIFHTSLQPALEPRYRTIDIARGELVETDRRGDIVVVLPRLKMPPLIS